jgi:hypothetical protein
LLLVQLCNTDGKYIKQVLEYGADVSISNFNYRFNIWFSFFALVISYFLFWFVQVAIKSKGQPTDEELMTILSSLCHFMMREYISPHGVFHTPDGHMAQFHALRDYIHQGQAKQANTHGKFREICGCQ